jgi:hypothetical protein
MLESNPRVLEPGVDLSLWPQLKFARARQLFLELSAKVDLHATSTVKGLRGEVGSEGLSATFHARITTPAPTYEWSLILADSIHNYRTALDALTWELAHLDGARPHVKFSKQIYFPICSSATQWRKQVEGPLASIPKDLLERLHSLQPYHVPPVDSAVGTILHRLDIADKHKSQLQTGVVARDKFQYWMRLSFQDGGGHDALPGDVQWLAGDEPVHDGMPIFQIRTSRPLVSAECDMALPVALTVSDGEAKHEVFTLMELIDEQVATTFEFVQTGQVAKAPGGLPLPL